MLSVACDNHAIQSYNFFIRIITIFAILVMTSPDAFCLTDGMTCGSKKPCTDGSCCSQYGFCGNTSAFCGKGCTGLCQQNSSTSSSSSMNGTDVMVSSSITNVVFDRFFYYHSESGCPAEGFYNLSSF
eukprot:c12750_g1_i1 orf=1-381(-)